MMKQFISPPEETEWRLDHEELARGIQARWPDAETCKVKNPASGHSLEWTLHPQARVLAGSLDRTGQIVALEGHIEDCAAFALWLRTLVPTRQRLLFYDEGYSADVEIWMETNEDHLVAPFLAHR